MPEIDVERGEGKAGRASNGWVGDVTIGVAVAVGVEDIRQESIRIRVDADESALARDREEHALVPARFKVDRSGGKALKGFTKAQHAREVGNRGGKTASTKSAKGVDAQELTTLADPKKAAGFILELKASDVADHPGGASTQLATAAPWLTVNRCSVGIAPRPVEV